MDIKVPYSKQTLDSPNPIARYAHRKRYELSIGKTLALLSESGVLLDFGCGKGDFLNLLKAKRPGLMLYGFDPESGHTAEKYEAISDIDDIEEKKIDVICCFETLEHLYDTERNGFYSNVKRLLATNGKVVISVPIIGGPSLLLKELNRIIIFRRKSDYTLKELFLASFFGVSAKRPANPRPTHKGFDFKLLENELRLHFKVLGVSYSPFSIFPWFFNSQVFYTLAMKK